MSKTWKFFRAGGFDQVQLETGDDLVNLAQLDQKLWVALACPVKGVQMDARTLELLDIDKDGRIRAPELVAASTWLGTMLKNPDELLKRSDQLPLSSINDAHDEGKRVVAAAKAVLQGLGKKDATSISVADMVEAVKAYDSMRFNGDGVVPPDAADDEETKQAALDVISALGAEVDRSGKPGVSGAKVEQFFKDVEAYVAWLKTGENDPVVMPLKEKTHAAFAAFGAVRAKVDDYFARCRLAAFDARAAAALNREEKEYLAIASKDLAITNTEIAQFPLSRVEANRPLPLTEAVNPAWSARLDAFKRDCLAPLLGEKTVLSEADWAAVAEKLSAHEKWTLTRAGASVEKLGVERLKALANPALKRSLEDLVAKDKAEEGVQKSVGSVEKLVRCHRDFYELCTNFVSFKQFYGFKKGIFQAGTLYLDQRACELCVWVDDAGKHATMAPLSRSYLAYCEIKSATGEKKQIAAAFSAGDSDNLMVGRNGLFYDRLGKDWDATITKIVDNPISIRQAFWSPYKKALRFIEDQINKRIADADAASSSKLTGTVAEVGAAAETGKVAEKKKIDIGTVAALGVAVGGITAALGALFGAFMGLGLWMPVGFLGLLLAISGPSMAIAWLKLRQRNLGPLLDANGWAVNALARVNVPFGRSLTQVASLPEGSSRDLRDPYAEKETPWVLYAVVLAFLGIGVAWYFGHLDRILPDHLDNNDVVEDALPDGGTASAHDAGH